MSPKLSLVCLGIISVIFSVAYAQLTLVGFSGSKQQNQVLVTLDPQSLKITGQVNGISIKQNYSDSIMSLFSYNADSECGLISPNSNGSMATLTAFNMAGPARPSWPYAKYGFGPVIPQTSTISWDAKYNFFFWADGDTLMGFKDGSSGPVIIGTASWDRAPEGVEFLLSYTFYSPDFEFFYFLRFGEWSSGQFGFYYSILSVRTGLAVINDGVNWNGDPRDQFGSSPIVFDGQKFWAVANSYGNYALYYCSLDNVGHVQLYWNAIQLGVGQAQWRLGGSSIIPSLDLAIVFLWNNFGNQLTSYNLTTGAQIAYNDKADGPVNGIISCNVNV